MVGLVWLSCRTVFNNRSFLEEYLLYGQALTATLNIIMLSLHVDKRQASRAYFIINIVHWTLGIYCSADSLYPLHFNPGQNSSIPKYITKNISAIPKNSTNRTCCPNHDLIQWNRHFYFAGFQLFLAPMAVTQALQAIHLIIAAGALSNTQHTLWPGVSIGYALLGTSSFFTAVKFLNYITKPCPDTTIHIFDNITWQLSTLLMFYVFAFSTAGIVEGFIHTSIKTRLMWNFLTIGLIGCYAITTIWNLFDLQIITWSWIVFTGLGIIPFAYTFIEIMYPADTEIEYKPKLKGRTRFVMPIQTDLKSSKKD